MNRTRRVATVALVATALLPQLPATGAAGPATSQATCAPVLAATGIPVSEGPPNATDASTIIRSTGMLHAKVLFVDFPDVPGSTDPGSMASGWMMAGTRWLAGSSYGRLRVELDPELRWLRMPKASSAYGFGPGLTYETHRDYIADAIAVADPSTDFSRADLLYVVAAPNPSMVGSSAFHGLPGVFNPDGHELHAVVTIGSDGPTYGRTVFAHETGHLFGLPDLYAFTPGDPHRFVGVWDVMGNIFKPTDFGAWHRLKVGWLDASQFVCARSTGVTQTVLTPLAKSGGRKAVFIRTSPTTALVVENRQRIGNDIGICRSGLVVTRIDAAVATGHGPIRVIGGHLGNGCGYGPRSDAPLRPGQRVTIGRTTVTALAASGRNLGVRIVRR